MQHRMNGFAEVGNIPSNRPPLPQQHGNNSSPVLVNDFSNRVYIPQTINRQGSPYTASPLTARNINDGLKKAARRTTSYSRKQYTECGVQTPLSRVVPIPEKQNKSCHEGERDTPHTPVHVQRENGYSRSGDSRSVIHGSQIFGNDGNGGSSNSRLLPINTNPNDVNSEGSTQPVRYRSLPLIPCFPLSGPTSGYQSCAFMGQGSSGEFNQPILLIPASSYQGPFTRFPLLGSSSSFTTKDHGKIQSSAQPTPRNTVEFILDEGPPPSKPPKANDVSKSPFSQDSRNSIHHSSRNANTPIETSNNQATQTPLVMLNQTGSSVVPLQSLAHLNKTPKTTENVPTQMALDASAKQTQTRNDQTVLYKTPNTEENIVTTFVTLGKGVQPRNNSTVHNCGIAQMTTSNSAKPLGKTKFTPSIGTQTTADVSMVPDGKIKKKSATFENCEPRPLHALKQDNNRMVSAGHQCTSKSTETFPVNSTAGASRNHTPLLQDIQESSGSDNASKGLQGTIQEDLIGEKTPAVHKKESFKKDKLEPETHRLSATGISSDVTKSVSSSDPNFLPPIPEVARKASTSNSEENCATMEAILSSPESIHPDLIEDWTNIDIAKANGEKLYTCTTSSELFTNSNGACTDIETESKLANNHSSTGSNVGQTTTNHKVLSSVAELETLFKKTSSQESNESLENGEYRSRRGRRPKRKRSTKRGSKHPLVHPETICDSVTEGCSISPMTILDGDEADGRQDECSQNGQESSFEVDQETKVPYDASSEVLNDNYQEITGFGDAIECAKSNETNKELKPNTASKSEIDLAVSEVFETIGSSTKAITHLLTLLCRDTSPSTVNTDLCAALQTGCKLNENILNSLELYRKRTNGAVETNSELHQNTAGSDTFIPHLTQEMPLDLRKVPSREFKEGTKTVSGKHTGSDQEDLQQGKDHVPKEDPSRLNKEWDMTETSATEVIPEFKMPEKRQSSQSAHTYKGQNLEESVSESNHPTPGDEAGAVADICANTCHSASYVLNHCASSCDSSSSEDDLRLRIALSETSLIHGDNVPDIATVNASDEQSQGSEDQNADIDQSSNRKGKLSPSLNNKNSDIKCTSNESSFGECVEFNSTAAGPSKASSESSNNTVDPRVNMVNSVSKNTEPPDVTDNNIRRIGMKKSSQSNSSPSSELSEAIQNDLKSNTHINGSLKNSSAHLPVRRKSCESKFRNFANIVKPSSSFFKEHLRTANSSSPSVKSHDAILEPTGPLVDTPKSILKPSDETPPGKSLGPCEKYPSEHKSTPSITSTSTLSKPKKGETRRVGKEKVLKNSTPSTYTESPDKPSIRDVESIYGPMYSALSPDTDSSPEVPQKTKSKVLGKKVKFDFWKFPEPSKKPTGSVHSKAPSGRHSTDSPKSSGKQSKSKPKNGLNAIANVPDHTKEDKIKWTAVTGGNKKYQKSRCKDTERERELQDGETETSSKGRKRKYTRRKVDHIQSPSKPSQSGSVEIIPPRKTRGLREEMKQNCFKVFDRVYNYSWSEPFRDEIKPELVPGYLEVVKRPLCLRTVACRLRQGDYTDIKWFVKDMKQIFINCHTYHEPLPLQVSAQLLIAAKHAEEFLDKQLEKVFPGFEL